jgi:N-methylhydantoinase A/oxoprolinase/acetone carboxylase beta subunit
MGGTSADIGIVTERGVAESSARDTWVAGYPLLVPMVDVHTIGAGGGSIAYADEGGAFRVGPRSAGASPGPACYGLGGEQATITDAHVVLGRIDPDRFLDGDMQLDRDLAVAAVERLAESLGIELLEAAEGIITIANAGMARAIRSRTIEKGHDPREFTLVAFGGAGPLHAADLAELLGIPEVLVPPYPGITSATGLLTSDLKYDQMRTVLRVEGAVDVERLNRELRQLETELRTRLLDDSIPDEEILMTRSLDCRYAGQGYELRVTLPAEGYSPAALEEFHRLHEQEYGHAFRDPIEIVNLRVTAVGKRPTLGGALPTAGGSLDEALLGEAECVFRQDGGLASLATRYLERSRLPVEQSIPGPAVVFQRDTTTVVPPGWKARAETSGNLILSQ